MDLNKALSVIRELNGKKRKQKASARKPAEAKNNIVQKPGPVCWPFLPHPGRLNRGRVSPFSYAKNTRSPAKAAGTSLPPGAVAHSIQRFPIAAAPVLDW